MRIIHILQALSYLVLCVASHAAGQPAHCTLSPAVNALLADGTRLFQRSDPAALGTFEEAYQLSHDPAFIYNIALTHELLGHKQQAITAYERYIDILDHQPQERWCSDDTTHRRQVRHQAITRIRILRGSGPSDEDHFPWRTVGAVLGGAGLTALVAGAIAGGYAVRARELAEQGCPSVCRDSAESHVADAADRAMAANILLIAGSAALVSGGLMWLLGGDEEARDGSQASQRLHLGVRPRLDGGELSVSARF